MATVREGNRPVLIVVDVQVGVVNDSWDAPRIVKNVSRAVERARLKQQIASAADPGERQRLQLRLVELEAMIALRLEALRSNASL